MTGIERLRELGNGISPFVEMVFVTLSNYCIRHNLHLAKGRDRFLRDNLLDIADQIAREMKTSDEGEKMKCDPDDVSVSAYDLLPADEREAIAWVREHGGIGHVRDQWSYLKGRANHADHVDRRLAKRQRQIDESHAALRRKSERIGFLVSELNRANNENHEMFIRRAGDYTAFADEVCKRLAPELRYVEGCSKDVMDAAIHALDRRLMPDGGWPRFNDGEMVLVGSDFADGLGETHTVTSIEFLEDGTLLHWNPDEPEECVWIRTGEHVKRRAPKVLAGDDKSLTRGEHVWHEDGTELRVLDFLHEEDGETLVKVERVSGPTNWVECRSLSLTHERPDSLDRLAEDIGAMVVAWRSNRDLFDAQEAAAGCVGENTMGAALESLVRRAKALAGDA